MVTEFSASGKQGLSKVIEFSAGGKQELHKVTEFNASGKHEHPNVTEFSDHRNESSEAENSKSENSMAGTRHLPISAGEDFDTSKF